jgi:hypothetical protein
MKSAPEMVSCAIIYIPRSVKTSSSIQKLMARGRGEFTNTKHGDSISLFSFC